MLVHESFATLQAQVDHLVRGTLFLVYFPVGTGMIPVLPSGFDSLVIENVCPGQGMYYFNPSEIPIRSIRIGALHGTFHRLLGYVQSKQDALRGRHPMVVVARDANGLELKAALVDASLNCLLNKQREVLRQQFPDCALTIELPARVILDRIREAA